MGFLKNPFKSIKKWVTHPGDAFENSIGSVGLTKQNYRGFQKNVLKNPLVQGAAGLGLSFVPGMQWYAPLALGAGMSVAGGGNLNDDLSGAGMAGLGFGAGNLAQAGYASAQGAFSGLGSSGPTTTVTEFGPGMNAPVVGPPAPAASEFAGEISGQMAGPGPTRYFPGMPSLGNAGNVALNVPGVEGAVTPAQLTSGASFGGAPMRTAGRIAYSGGTGMGGTGMNRRTVLGLMGAKTGLGYLSNLQAQKAMEPELDERRRAMGRIRRLQENPGLAYRNDPGLRTLRSRALDTVESRYRAKFGGGEGGAFARDLSRTGAAADRAVLNDALSSEYRMLGVTQPALAYNQAAGGTGLGAFTGPATGAITDYALMEFLRGL